MEANVSTVAIDFYMRVEHTVLVLKKQLPFPLATAELTGELNTFTIGNARQM
jgi:hypothetical protein